MQDQGFLESGGALSMQFKGLSGDDVQIDATRAQRLELAEFLQQSIETKQIETGNHAGSVEGYADIAQKILGQKDDTQPLTLTRVEFVNVANLADAWQTYGFDVGGDTTKYDVSRQTVSAVQKMTDDYMQMHNLA